MSLQPGTIVNGRYEVVKCLGTGSMGLVYACRHRELAGHIVAMKVLFSEVARDEVAAARFRNEIVASYGVSHPNVVRAYEYFRDGDLIAFTMEYIGGGDLADRINSDVPLPIVDIVRMLSQMCSGVQAIHDAGIIHRDLKPENILLTAQNDIKITDFGIARTEGGPKLTEYGGVVGTIDYVSPEYLEKGQVDGRSDIYALGVMAFEMITGESPFKGKSVIETMTMRLKTDAEPPHHLRHECPTALSDIVLKALSRDPDTRYQLARQMLADLNSLKDAASGPPRRAESPRADSALNDDGRVGIGAGRALGSGRSGRASSISRGMVSNSNEGWGSSDQGGRFGDERVPAPPVHEPMTVPTLSGTMRSHVPTATQRVQIGQSQVSLRRISTISMEESRNASNPFRSLFIAVFVTLLGVGVGLAVISQYEGGGFLSSGRGSGATILRGEPGPAGRVPQ